MWAGPVIIAAALLTGILFSLVSGAIGAIYLWCFALGVIAVCLLVNPRGLFITVASIPLLFAVFTPLGAWLVSSQLMGGMQRLSMTTLITIVFPLMQLFPQFLLITLIGLVIALLRWSLLRRQHRLREAQARESRKKDAEAERRNQETTRRARERTHSSTHSAAATAASASNAPGSSPRHPRRTPGGGEKSSERIRTASATTHSSPRSSHTSRDNNATRSSAENQATRTPRSSSSRTQARQITVEELLRRSGRSKIIGNTSEDIYTRRLPEEEETPREPRRRRAAEPRPSSSDSSQRRDRYLAYGERYHGFRDREDRHYQRDDWERSRERRYRSSRNHRDERR